MQQKKSKRPYSVTVEFKHGMTRVVKVKAANRETAERRALKFHPGAQRVKRDVA